MVDAGETAELSTDAIGFAISDLDFGMLLMTPTAAALPGIEKYAPRFYALKGSADFVGLVGIDEVRMELKGIEVRANGCTPSQWPLGFWQPVVDFETTFDDDLNNDGLADPTGQQDEVVDKDGGEVDQGFEVITGGEPVILDFVGEPLIGGSVEQVLINICDYVFIAGSFSFEQGPIRTVELKGGLLGDSLERFDELLEQFGLPSDYPVPIIGAEKQLQFMTIGASDLRALSARALYCRSDEDGEYFDINEETGERTPEGTNDEAIGLVLDDLDFGGIMMPTCH
jgi:hypothetical protein